MYFCLSLEILKKNISKNVIDRKRQNDNKQSATEPLKTTSNIVTRKAVEATGKSIGNEIADKITTTVLRSNIKLLNKQVKNQ